jgi:hypothetical protein
MEKIEKASPPHLFLHTESSSNLSDERLSNHLTTDNPYLTVHLSFQLATPWRFCRRMR